MELSRNKYLEITKLSFVIITLFFISCKSQKIINSNSINEAIKDKNRITSLTILNNNQFKEFPSEIFLLKKLKKLSFVGCECDYLDTTNCKNIELISNDIKKLYRLEQLSLVMNNLKSIPDEINRLKKLKQLDLSNNTSINIDNLNNPYIENLSLNDCNLKKLPLNLSNMKNLKTLGIEGNNIPIEDIVKLKKELPNCIIYW